MTWKGNPIAGELGEIVEEESCSRLENQYLSHRMQIRVYETAPRFMGSIANNANGKAELVRLGTSLGFKKRVRGKRKKYSPSISIMNPTPRNRRLRPQVSEGTDGKIFDGFPRVTGKN